jgi:chemotaxis response regulator CheB
MPIAVFSSQRLQREAIRRSLSRSQIVVDFYAASLDGWRNATTQSKVRLCLLEPTLPGIDDAVNELPKLGIAVAILSQSDALDAVYRAATGNLTVLVPPVIDDNGELHGGSRFLLQMERMLNSLSSPSSPSPLSGAKAPVQHQHVHSDTRRILAIGASTGGPTAIRTLLNALERPLSFAVLIVQHIDADYAQGFCDWLSSECQLPTQFGSSDASLQIGRVYVAPPGRHMIMNVFGQIELQPGSPDDAHTPAVAELFASLALQRKVGVAVLLTGMGVDGASGLRQLRDRGWQTFAQDAESSAVHGMPGAAIAQGGASHILNPTAIGKYISNIRTESR